MAEDGEELYGPCNTELVSIVKGYEMFGILLNEKIPPDVKSNRIWKLLKSSHVNVNFCYKHFESNTLLHMAVGKGYVDIVKVIIDRKANVNMQNEAGDTPMHVAVVRNNAQIIDILLKNGADISIKNYNDVTPLDVATTTNKCFIENLLKTGGRQQMQDENMPLECESTIILKDSEPEKQKRDITFTGLPKTHGASGAKNSFHGTVYQLKLLMLFLVRALNLGYQFYLGTEVDEAEQFDDLVFHCLIGENIKSLYLQAKHKENKETGKIKMSDLLATDKKAPFSLLKYFRSYLKIKQRIKDKADEIDYFICTNTDFNFNKPLKIFGKKWEFTFEEVKTSYDDFFKEGKCYKLVLNEPVIFGLGETLKEEIQALEETIKICTDKESNKEDKKEERKEDKEEDKKEDKKKDKKEDREEEKNVDNKEDSEEEKREVKEEVLEEDNKGDKEEGNIEVKKEDKKEIKEEEKIIKTLKAELESLKVMRQSVEEDENINVKLFLEKLIFAVEQPNEDILDKNIKAEFGVNFNINLQDNELINSAYLKQMFDWFKEKGLVKGEEGTFLSHKDAKQFMHSIFSRVNNLVSSGISRAYTEELKASDITFNTDQYQLINNAISTNKIVHLVTTKVTRLSAIKIVQALDYSNEFNTDDSYLLLQLSTLLIDKTQNIIEGAFSSPEIYKLLAIECSQTREDVSALYEKLSKILKDTSNISKKLIIIAENNHPLAEMLKTQDGYFQFKVINEFKELSTKSQEAMLEKPIIFQGHSIQLKKLITGEADTQLLGIIPLEALFKDEMMVIGANVPTSKGYNESFYIDRTVQRKIKINKEIFDDKLKYLCNDFIATTVSEFNEMCERNPNSNVHLLKEHDERYIWVRTKGSLETLHRYVDESNCESFTETTFLDSVKSQKVVIISDPAGMGKSTILTSISKQFKKISPETIVYRIDLDNFTDDLRKVGATQFTKSSSVDFVCNCLIINMTPFEKELFRRMGKSVLLFDGFDEISPDYGDTVIDLLKNLKAATDAQLWITTRPFKRSELENNLQQFAYTLEPFSEENQFEFLTKYWKDSLKINESKEDRVGDFARSLIRNLMTSISDKEREFTGIPLQIRMLAECFEEDVRIFADTDLPEPIFGDNFNLIGLYKKFITRKYNVYHTEKAKAADDSNLAAKSTQKILEEAFMIHHELWALRAILPDKFELLTKGSATKISLEDNLSDLNRFGIVQVIDSKPYFMHRTFAEYFIAVFLLDLLKQNQEEDIKVFVLLNILTEESFLVIRAFLNGLLENTKPHLLALVDFGKRIVELLDGGNIKSKLHASDENGKQREKMRNYRSLGKTISNKTMVHIAAEEGNQAIILYICFCVKTYPDELRSILMCADSNEATALHLATSTHNSTIVETLLQWIKDNSEKEWGVELLRSLLQAQDNSGATVLHKMAKFKDRLEKLLHWIRDNMEQDNFQKSMQYLLLTNTNYGLTVLNEASYCLDAMLLLLQWIQHYMDQYGVNILWSLLLNVNNEGDSILHGLVTNAVDGSMVVGLLDWIREEMDEEGIRILRSLLPIVNNEGNTVLHRSINASNGSLTLQLLKWILRYMNQNQDQDILRSLLLNRNNNEETVLHLEAEGGGQHLEPLMKFIRCSMGDDEGQDILEELLLAPDIKGDEPIHTATKWGNEDSFERLLNGTRENLDEDRLQAIFRSMLLSYGEGGLTVLQRFSADTRSVELLNKIFNSTIEILGEDEGRELLGEILTDTTTDGQNVLHLAAGAEEAFIVSLLKWTLDIIGQDRVENILLNKDSKGFTVLHLIRNTPREHTSLACIMLTWTKNNIKKDQNHDLLQLLLLARSDNDETILHTAADHGSGSGLVSILQWIKDNMDQNQGQSEILLTSILLAKVKNGDSVLHIAARHGYGEVMMPLLRWVQDNVTLEGQSITRLMLIDENENGDTLLHIAVENRFGLFVASLLKWVRDKLDNIILCDLMLVRNNAGKTAMDLGKDRYEEDLKIFDRTKISEKEPSRVRHDLHSSLVLKEEVVSMRSSEERFPEIYLELERAKAEGNDVSWNCEEGDCVDVHTSYKNEVLNFQQGQEVKDISFDINNRDINLVLNRSESESETEVESELYADLKEYTSSDHNDLVSETLSVMKGDIEMTSLWSSDVKIEKVSGGSGEACAMKETEWSQDAVQATPLGEKCTIKLLSLGCADNEKVACDSGDDYTTKESEKGRETAHDTTLVENDVIEESSGWGFESSEMASSDWGKEFVLKASEWGEEAMELTSGWGYDCRDLLSGTHRAAIVDILQRFERDYLEPTINETLCD